MEDEGERLEWDEGLVSELISSTRNGRGRKKEVRIIRIIMGSK